MLMERDIFHKHKIENRVKKNLLKCSFYTIMNFSISLQFLIEILHFLLHAYFGHITTFISKNQSTESTEKHWALYVCCAN
jgi:hypothetical protein